MVCSLRLALLGKCEFLFQGALVADFHHDEYGLLRAETVLMFDDEFAWFVLHLFAEFAHDRDLAQNYLLEFVSVVAGQLLKGDLLHSHPLLVCVVVPSVYLSKAAFTKNLAFTYRVSALF